jgi:hypothetical protein
MAVGVFSANEDGWNENGVEVVNDEDEDEDDDVNARAV